MANTQKQQPAGGGGGSGGGSVTHSPERLRGGATQDLFELLERVQCSRLDDQRCVLPAYFSQVCNHRNSTKGNLKSQEIRLLHVLWEFRRRFEENGVILGHIETEKKN